jgi:hypothetical protein
VTEESWFYFLSFLASVRSTSSPQRQCHLQGAINTRWKCCILELGRLCTLDQEWKNKSVLDQGCQMVYFQTKNPNLCKFWSALDWRMVIYLMAICIILWTFGIFCDHLVHFVFIWYIFWFWYHVPIKIWQPCSGPIEVSFGYWKLFFASYANELA